MEPCEFSHKKFSAESWESELKDYINSIDCSDGIIWHRKREYKKINEELITLGYYVKYKYSGVKNIQFLLNRHEGKVDGWILHKDEKIESIQIVIAYYEHEDAIIDRRIMQGEDIVLSGWIVDAINLISERATNRAKKKADKEYQGIDTLLIGVRGWFARRLNTEHQSLEADFVEQMASIIKETNFKQLVVVDSVPVGRGELLIVPNQALQSTSGRDAAFIG